METTAKKYEIRATATNSDFESVQVRNAEDAATFAKQFYFDDIAIYESAFIMLLNRAHKVMGWAKISQGGTASTVLDKKIICKYAIDTLAEAVILIHNHPSDNAKPSTADNSMTTETKNALAILGVQLLDHIILTPSGDYFSYQDNCMI